MCVWLAHTENICGNQFSFYPWVWGLELSPVFIRWLEFFLVGSVDFVPLPPSPAEQGACFTSCTGMWPGATTAPSGETAHHVGISLLLLRGVVGGWGTYRSCLLISEWSLSRGIPSFPQTGLLWETTYFLLFWSKYTSWKGIFSQRVESVISATFSANYPYKSMSFCFVTHRA